MWSPLCGGNPNQHVDPGFGDAVGAHVPVGDGAADARHRHYGSAAATVDHRPSHRAHRQPRTGEVDVDDASPVRWLLLHQQTRGADTGAGDQAIRHAHGRQRLLQSGRHRRGITDVTAYVAALDIPAEHIVAGLTQSFDHGFADTGTAAGHDGTQRAAPISSTRTPSGAVITAI